MIDLYFITTIRVGKNEIYRCIGFYDELKVARDVLKKHSECLGESGWYKYAVIECFRTGWYPNASMEDWYEFRDRDKKVVRIKKPKSFKSYCNFGIG